MQSMVSSSGNSFKFQPNVPEGYAKSLENMTKQSSFKLNGCQIRVAILENNYGFRSCKNYTGRLGYPTSSFPLWLYFMQL